jgi:hypothetical protein
MGGLASCLTFFVAFTVTQVSLLMRKVLLGKWAEEPATRRESNNIEYGQRSPQLEERVIIYNLNGSVLRST